MCLHIGSDHALLSDSNRVVHRVIKADLLPMNALEVVRTTIATQVILLHQCNDLKFVPFLPCLQEELSSIETKLRSLEADLKKKGQTIRDLKATIREMIKGR